MKSTFKSFTLIFLLLITSVCFSASKPQLIIETNYGNITIEVYPDKAPITVKNFLSYVEKGFYNQTIFHRVINGFMIQGGGFDKDMNQKETDAPVKNEASNGLKNEIYTIAMARTSIPDSATSQFFINVASNSSLDYPGQDGAGYCVFGKVVDGIKVVKKISKLSTTTKSGMGDVPIKKVTIKLIKKR
jgi:cyclophilin family peptidyl-prolyl cis-trans isomerase